MSQNANYSAQNERNRYSLDADGGPTPLPRSAGRSAFGIDAAGYDVARSGYPQSLFATNERRASYRTILEVGAGTGLATQGLLNFQPDRILAIEPDPALARFLKQRIVDHRLEVRTQGFGDVQINESFDLVAAASSFHWLEPEPSLREMRKLLVPNGTLALWWNSYRQPHSGDAFTDAVAHLLEDVALAPSESRNGHYSLDEPLHRRQLTKAGFIDIEHHVFRTERWIDAAQARALFASYSFVRALPLFKREQLLGEVARIVEDRFGGCCPNQIVSALYTATSP